MQTLGLNARIAAKILAAAKPEQKNSALHAMAKAIRAAEATILTANANDLLAAQSKDLKPSFVDRLTLNPARIEDMAKGLEAIAALNDPVGRVLEKWTRPNGMEISRVSVPIGVIGIIYESRPNVTADSGGLCLKSGNAVILRGGSDAFATSQIIVEALRNGLQHAGLNPNIIQMVQTADRTAVSEMLSGLGGKIDLIIPRGGKGLTSLVNEQSRVPVFSHLEGICHVYVDKAADLEMAKSIVLNSKMRRTGVCGSAETILVDRAKISNLAPIISTLINSGCEVRGDAETMAENTTVKRATEEDWSTEYLDSIVSMCVVDGVQGAIDHITKYGSQHTDSIVTGDQNAADYFLNHLDSAIVLHNASTQFADGGEFGFGAEIGIATGKLHARGPVGVDQLTTFKYQIRGSGQIRPA